MKTLDIKVANKFFLFTVIILLLLCTIKIYNSHFVGPVYNNSVIVTDVDWKNPSIACELMDHETPLRQFSSLVNNIESNATGFNDFCTRMSDRFFNSETKIAEAEIVYKAISTDRIIDDDSYGMPSYSPNDKQVTILEDKNVQDRVAIKNIKENTYDIFYKYSGCGNNYVHKQITLQNGNIISKNDIEIWSASFPC